MTGTSALLTDKPAPTMLVTGASTGIGRAIALHFASQGWHVFATVRKAEDGASVEQEYSGLAKKQAGGKLEPVLLDVTNEDTVVTGVAQVKASCGDRGLQVLVNNAGIAVVGPLETTPTDVWRRVYETNVFGVATVTRHCLPLLRAGAKAARALPGGARVIIIGSGAGKLAAPLQAVYSSSKFAVEGLTDALRGELAPQGIHVVCMELGVVKTAISGKMRHLSSTLTTPSPGATTGGEDVAALYQKQITEMYELLDALEATQTIPMEKVLTAMDRAVNARRPDTRYAVDGQIAAVLTLRWMMTDRMWDRFYPWASNFTKSNAAKAKAKQ